MGCRTDERPAEGLLHTQDTILDRPQALVSPVADEKVVNPKIALLYWYLAKVTVMGALPDTTCTVFDML